LFDSPPTKQITLDAIYQDGVLKPVQPLALREGSVVTLVVADERDASASDASDHGHSAVFPGLLFAWRHRLAVALTLEGALFTLAVAVYTVTRLWALDQFPIYFFTDEAAGPLWAEQLISRGLRDAQGSLLPIYFEQAPQRWMPLLSVYFHLPVVALFGKSIIATRATSALVSVLGAVSVGLILKVGFRARYWWTGVLFMAISPAWFIHSRTAFETVIMASFYACFLLFYFLYRGSSPRYIFPCLVAGAVAFYSYSNGQAMVGSLGILLLLSDLRYHLRQWRIVMPALLIGLVLAVPLIGFQLTRPGAMQEHLHVIGSYLVEPIPLNEKLGRFAQLYLYALSPQYWFLPNNTDLVRHVMKGYGHIQIAVLPLVVAGTGLCLWRIREWQFRALLLAALATPVGAALDGIGVTRVLAFVVPAAVVAGLGLELLVQRFADRVPRTGLAIAIAALISLSGLVMLQQALTEGPFWFRDYGLYGMQYGAKQLFEQAIPEYLKSNPGVRLVVSPTWANGADNFPRFFLSREQQGRMQMGTIDSFIRSRGDLGPNVVLVMTPTEYNQARGSSFFKSVQVDRVIPYPDGTPGFYFARLAYADNVDALMAADREMRRQLVDARVQIGGQTVSVRHSQLDMGQLRDIFDGDPRSLARGAEANPFVLEITFPGPRPLAGLAVDVNHMEFSLSASLYAAGSDQPLTYSKGYPADSSHGELSFPSAPQSISRVRVEIRNLRAGDTDHIHIYELVLQPEGVGKGVIFLTELG